MEINALPFDSLPFSALFKQLINEQKEATALFEHPVFETDRVISEHIFKGNRTEIVRLISKFNANFDPTAEVTHNIDRLALPNALCVVTGQQLGMLGGPVFTLYKILSTIALARRLELAHQRPVIPIFWLADEDHDIDEIIHVNVLQKGDYIPLTYRDPDALPIPVADRTLSNEIATFIEQVLDQLEPTPHTATLKAQLLQSYQPGYTHRAAFGKLIMQWFGKYGLVLVGSNDTDIKAWLKPVLTTAVTQVDALYQALETQSQKVETSFKRQAQISDSLLFYLDPKANQARYRIKHELGAWFTETGNRWTTSELLDEIQRNPEHFSPNVFLRPLLQDVLLPTIAYVAGPGEMAYYAQMRLLYPVFGLKMPLITPRHSVTLLDPGLSRNLQQLPFTFQDYHQRIEDLERIYVTQHQSINADHWAETWVSLIRTASESSIRELATSDPTLKASAEKTLAETEASIIKIKQKWVKSLKEKEHIALQRLQRVKNATFPHQELQERALSTIYFLNKHGFGVIDQLLSTFEAHKADHHYLLLP